MAEQLEPPELFDLFVRHREALGMEVIGLSAEGRRAAADAALRSSNHLIALVADRDLTGRGVEVEMFGRTAQAPGGPGAAVARDRRAARRRADLPDARTAGSCVMYPPCTIEPTGDRRADVAPSRS